MKRIFLLSFLVSLVAFQAMAQRTVSGSVVDATGAPLPGVNVIVVGTGSGVNTDLDGKYRIEVSGDDATLRFSFIGFSSQDIVVGSRSVIDITMTEDAQALEEVVIMGYSAVKRGDLTSSVSTVSGDDIRSQPIGSIDNLLQGKSTGMLVTAQNGRPGGQAYIRIRGIGSVNASNEPLFIIDGVQMTQSDYNALDPNDIENISILKDAASTSIYGARASNGVILISTRRGGSGRPRISYSFQYGQKDIIPLPFEMMNKEQKLQYEVDLGYRTQEDADLLRNSLASPDTDWQDILLRTGIVESHDASISGGNDISKYYVSLGSYSEQGISVGSFFDRLNGRANFEFQSTDWLKFGNTLNISRTNEQELRDRNNVQNPFRAMFSYNPYETEYILDDQGNQVLDANGEPIYNLTRQGFSISEAIANNPERIERTHIIGTLFAEAKPMEGLTLKSTIGSNYQIYRREYYIQPGSVLDGYVGDPNAPGIKTDNGHDRFINTWTNIATYGRQFGDHSINVLGGTEFLGYDIQRYSISGKGFPSEDFSTQNNASEITGGNTSRDQYTIWSQFGKLSYGYGERYFADFSLRRDGSSRFGSNAKYGLFWAGSIGWNLHEEAFMAGMSSVINQLKPRFAIGTSGNVPNQFYAARGLYGFGSYNNQSSSAPSQLANPDLQWEENFNYSIGLDFAFLNSRITGAFDYYNRTTDNLLFNRPLSQTVGFGSRLENVGSFNNYGIELEVRADVIRASTADGLNFQVFGSVSTNQNRVVSLDNGGEDILSTFTVLREGLPINTYFDVRYAGTNPANGEKLYLDTAGMVTNVYSSDYAVALEGKSPLPTYFGNFGLNFDFKGLTLSTNFYYQGGNYIYNVMEQVLMSDGANVAQNQMADALNYWQEPGDTGVLPVPDRTSNNPNSDRYIQKGDFIRLRNLQLGYSLPKAILEPIKMQDVQLYVQGTNLWTFNPYYNGDPEVGRGSEESGLTSLGETNLFTFPNARGITMGVNVTF